MTENGKSSIRLPVTWAVIVSVVCAAVTWGVNAQRIDTLERDTAKVEAGLQRTDAHISATDADVQQHETEIAVLKSKLDAIIETLGKIDNKLERAERRRQ